MSLLTVSPSPHIRSAMSTQKIMLAVILALVPAIAAGTIFFGPRALILVVFCALISMLTEAVCRFLEKGRYYFRRQRNAYRCASGT